MDTSSFWQFVNNHEFITFFLCGAIIWGICAIVQHITRHLNILHAGWPPPHLDADGDFKKVLKLE